MNGDYYEGDWQAGLRHGRGMQQCADGSNYVSFLSLCTSAPDHQLCDVEMGLDDSVCPARFQVTVR